MVGFLRVTDPRTPDSASSASTRSIADSIGPMSSPLARALLRALSSSARASVSCCCWSVGVAGSTTGSVSACQPSFALGHPLPAPSRRTGRTLVVGGGTTVDVDDLAGTDVRVDAAQRHRADAHPMLDRDVTTRRRRTLGLRSGPGWRRQSLVADEAVFDLIEGADGEGVEEA